MFATLSLLYGTLCLTTVVFNVAWMRHHITDKSTTTKLRSTLRRFVLHLSVADLLACVSIWPTIVQWDQVMIPSDWNQSDLCGVTAALQQCATTAQAYTLTTLAILWYNSPVVKPRGVSTRQCRLLAVVIWTLALTMAAPMLLYRYDDRHSTGGDPPSPTLFGGVCSVRYPLAWHYLTYLFQSLVVTVVIPLAVCSFCYAVVAKTLWSITDQDGVSPALTTGEIELLETTFSCTVCYVLCWLPHSVVSIGTHYVHHSTGVDHGLSAVVNWCYALGLANCLLRPYVCLLFSAKFRSAFLDSICRIVCCGRRFKCSSSSSPRSPPPEMAQVRYSTLTETESVRNSQLYNHSDNDESITFRHNV